MLSFLKYVLGTIVGLFIFFFIGFLILIGIAASTASSDEITLTESSVLELKLNKPISERDPDNPLAELGIAFGSLSSTDGLDQIKAAIRRAKTDDNIEGIFLNMTFVDGGMAKLEEIRNELIAFKKSGKFASIWIMLPAACPRSLTANNLAGLNLFRVPPVGLNSHAA